MSTREITQKEKELVAVAASIASGCLSCTKHHMKSAYRAGASEAEVLRATDIGLDMANNATKMMAEAAQRNQNNEKPVKAQSDALEPPLDDLVSLGAALACNSATGLEYYWNAARVAGASTRQIQTAIRIARGIRKEATEKADIGNLIEPNQVKTDKEPAGRCLNADNNLCTSSSENVVKNAEKQKDSARPSCDCS